MVTWQDLANILKAAGASQQTAADRTDLHIDAMGLMRTREN